MQATQVALDFLSRSVRPFVAARRVCIVKLWLWRVVMRHFNDALGLHPRVKPSGGLEAAAALGAAGVGALTAAYDEFWSDRVDFNRARHIVKQMKAGARASGAHLAVGALPLVLLQLQNAVANVTAAAQAAAAAAAAQAAAPVVGAAAAAAALPVAPAAAAPATSAAAVAAAPAAQVAAASSSWAVTPLGAPLHGNRPILSSARFCACSNITTNKYRWLVTRQSCSQDSSGCVALLCCDVGAFEV
jgi:hypothetical protein